MAYQSFNRWYGRGFPDLALGCLFRGNSGEGEQRCPPTPNMNGELSDELSTRLEKVNDSDELGKRLELNDGFELGKRLEVKGHLVMGKVGVVNAELAVVIEVSQRIT